jgi:hypothetical protein
VKIFPGYILVNHTGVPLLYRQKNHIFSLQPNDEIPFYWTEFGQSTTQKLSIRIDPFSSTSNLKPKENEILDESYWSAGFSITNGNDFFQLKLRDIKDIISNNNNQTTGDQKLSTVSYVMISVNIKSLKETTFVVFEKQEHSLYEVDNQTSEVIYIKQKVHNYCERERERERERRRNQNYHNLNGIRLI